MSNIWNYFKVTGDSDRASCNSCGQTYSCKSGTTSSLINHLKSKHQGVHQDFLNTSNSKRSAPPSVPQQPKSKQPRLEECIPVNEKVLNEAVDEAIVDFLADSGVAFRVVGLDSFKN